MRGELGSRACHKCDGGKISVAGGNCTGCGRGSYANPDKTECVSCKKGTWSSTVGADDITACKNCSAGKYSSAKGVRISQAAIHAVLDDSLQPWSLVHLYVSIVSVDTYASSPGQTSCKDCDDGTLTKGKNGSTTCDMCDAGEEVSGELGSRECAKCVLARSAHLAGTVQVTAGSYSNQGGTKCVSCRRVLGAALSGR